MTVEWSHLTNSWMYLCIWGCSEYGYRTERAAEFAGLEHTCPGRAS